MRFQLLLLLLVFSATTQAANQLQNHHSPYLALHGEDPIEWMQWNADVLAKAQAEKKLIFISVGYFACHWCHVMHQESFQDPVVAKFLNEHYVSVKVDRELNPVLDKRLIDFVQITAGRAGWPLNVILTPKAYSIAGGTYLPRDIFLDALQRFSGHWEQRREQLTTEAVALNNEIEQLTAKNDRRGKKSKIAENVGGFLSQAMDRADSLQGGFGDQSKFPSIMQLMALLHINRREQRDDIDEFLLLTLDQMRHNGLHDEIGGGFFRYTVDPDWQTPHYEKMLYTNAMMTMLYFDAARQYSRPDYRDTAIETLNFLREFMRTADGGYIASLSAVDDKDIEGGYYLFHAETLDSILSPDEFALLKQAWELERHIQSEAGNLPVMRRSLAELAVSFNSSKTMISNKLQNIRTKLKTWRDKNRVLPKDDKLLSGWNALVLSAYAHAYDDYPQSRGDGAKLAGFLSDLWDGEKLYKSSKKLSDGTMGDYAAVAWGLMRWGHVSGDETAMQTAGAIVHSAWNKFHGEKGWLEADKSLLPGNYQRTHIEDSPIPSPETLLLETTELMPDTQANSAIKARLADLLALSSHAIESNPYRYASLIAFASR